MISNSATSLAFAAVMLWCSPANAQTEQQPTARAAAQAELLPTSLDAVEGAGVLMRLAAIYARGGDTSDAVAILRKLLASSTAGFVCSAQLLRIDPTWDRIRADPDFKVLLRDAGTLSDATP